MPCYHPLDGWRSRRVNESGKRSIVFNRSEGFVDMPIKVPCGQCIGCRLERSRQWAVRCVHESSLYDRNCFVTLTYNDDHLPDDMNLNGDHVQKFMKRLRKKYHGDKMVIRKDKNGNDKPTFPIRFFLCGEYGTVCKICKQSIYRCNCEKFIPWLGRPHYHLCLFNFDFPDKKVWSKKRGFLLYRSEELERLWEKGHSIIGDVSFESAAYVARYVVKKIGGKDADDHYTEVDKTTGEILSERVPEFVRMSRRPGIGADWLDKYESDIYNHDYVIINGKKCRPPKYYDNRFELDNSEEFNILKYQRKKNTLTKKYQDDNISDRLKVKKTIQKRKNDLLIRSYENEEKNLCCL
jgi:hypothetical protein